VIEPLTFNQKPIKKSEKRKNKIIGEYKNG